MSTHMKPQVSLATALELVTSQNLEEQIEGTIELKRFATEPKNITTIINTGVIPLLMEFLESNNVQLAREASWTFINLCYGDNGEVLAIVDMGVVPILVNLVYSNDEEICNNALWALGNIVGNSAEMREYVFSQGITRAMLTVFKMYDKNVEVMRTATWVLDNLCKDCVDLEYVRRFIPTMISLFETYCDQEIVINLLWAFAYISDRNIQLVINTGILPQVAKYASKIEMRHPALRIMGNVASGTDAQTRLTIDLGLVSLLGSALKSKNVNVRREACWIASNIAAVGEEQAEMLINANLYPTIAELLDDEELSVRREAAWAVCNAIDWEVIDHIKYLRSWDVMEKLANLLPHVTDSRNKLFEYIVQTLQRFYQVSIYE